jgi:hypothetical protein
MHLVLERAQADPLTPKETFLQWTKDALKMDNEGRMYRFIQKSKSPLFRVIADTKLSEFKSNPSYADYQTLAEGINATREFIDDILSFLEEEAMDSGSREKPSRLAIKCMLFSDRLDRAN